MKKPITIDPQRLCMPALMLVFALGIAFRLYALLVTGFDEPFNLGGLFYSDKICFICAAVIP